MLPVPSVVDVDTNKSYTVTLQTDSPTTPYRLTWYCYALALHSFIHGLWYGSDVNTCGMHQWNDMREHTHNRATNANAFIVSACRQKSHNLLGQ